MSELTLSHAQAGETLSQRLAVIAKGIELRLDDQLVDAVLGPTLKTVGARIPDSRHVTFGAVVHLALLVDALCLAESAAAIDGVITDAELEYVRPLAREALTYLSRFRQYYEGFDVEGAGIQQLLDTHLKDPHPFGGGSAATRWAGVELCKRFARTAKDPAPLEQYRELLVRMVDDIFELTSDHDRASREKLRAELEEQLRVGMPVGTPDARVAAFCSPAGKEVFHAVAHARQVFEDDPFDVEEIHAEARRVFERIVTDADASQRTYGRMLLVKGESGAGKTHLMRAFRSKVHGERLGVVGYMQMSTATTDYPRYVITHLIESLEPSFVKGAPSTLSCIADALFQWAVPPRLARRLLEEDMGHAERADVIAEVVNHVVGHPQFEGIDVDLIRAFAYLKPDSPVIRSRVLRYLRCEELVPEDRKLLGGMAPSTDPDAPMRMLTGIGRLVSALGYGALVLLVDQLEDIHEQQGADQRLRLLMDTLRRVTDGVPSSVVVIACLDDYYTAFRGKVTLPILDRLEHDPAPVWLAGARTADEVERLIGRRLRSLLESQGASIRDDDPLWPFTTSFLRSLARMRTRDVLVRCRQYHEQCVHEKRIVEWHDGGDRPPLPPEPAAPPLEEAWRAHLENQPPPPLEDDARLDLLAWALPHAARQRGSHAQITRSADGEALLVTLRTDAQAAKVVVPLVNKPAQGGALGRQIDTAAKHAEKSSAKLVLLRCSEYPPPGRTAIAMKLGELLKQGARKVRAFDADWKTIAALRSFVATHERHAELAAFLSNGNALGGIEMLEVIACLAPAGDQTAPKGSPTNPEGKPDVARLEPKPPVVTPDPPKPTLPPKAGDWKVFVGRTRALLPVDVELDATLLNRHAAFLGSSGSGKTTLALNVIEQGLLRGIPAVLVDRKGDLATYGEDVFWSGFEPDEERARRRDALAAATDVRVFTPGQPQGRPLTLQAVPAGLSALPAHERQALATSAAAGLGAMMGYRGTQQDNLRLTILAKTIEYVASATSEDVAIEDLVRPLHEEDAGLVDAVGKLDPKHFRALVDHLETLRLRHEHLLTGEGERMTPDLLFGRGAHARPGKAALTIISTKFLSDASVVDFWVSRLLVELGRWASRNPAKGLQALVLLDEADIYLPAQSKPATKQPTQDLLRRGRSAGLGVLLATQSPGDLDYKCRDNIRTWFVGRVAEKTAVEKMKPLLSDHRGNPAAKLATARTGEFFVLAEGNVAELKAAPSLMTTRQLGEDEIVAVARRSREKGL